MNTSDVNPQIFEDCLTLLEKGFPLDEILNRYPQQAVELRTYLTTTRQIHQHFAAAHVPEAALHRSRAKFLKMAQAAAAAQAAADVKQSADRPQWLFWLPKFSFAPVRLSPYMRTAFLLILMVSFIGAFGAARVSARAIPGDVLYPIKRAAESTQLLFVQDPSQRLLLEKSFDSERVNEIQILTSQSKSMAEIEFGGPVESIGTTWKINGLVIETDHQTMIDTSLQAGDYAHVQGTLLVDGSVLAHRIEGHKQIFSGAISEISADRWLLGSVEILINERTQIDGDPQIGSRAAVQAILMENGKWLAVEIAIGSSVDEQFAAPSTTGIKASPTNFGEQPENENGKSPEPRNTPEPANTEEQHEIKASSTPEPRKTEEQHENEASKTPEPVKPPELEPTKEQRPADPTDEYNPSEGQSTQQPKPTDSQEHDGSRPTPSPTHKVRGEETKKPTPTRTPKPTDDD